MLTTRAIFWGISAAAIVMVFVAAWAERRQSRRRNLDRPGLISWPLIQILAIIITVVAAALALKA